MLKAEKVSASMAERATRSPDKRSNRERVSVLECGGEAERSEAIRRCLLAAGIAWQSGGVLRSAARATAVQDAGAPPQLWSLSVSSSTNDDADNVSGSMLGGHG